MLDISYEFFHSISKYSGDYENTRKTEIKPREECELNEEEYLFFSLFSKTYYYKVLTNFIGGYSKGELLIYRTPKMIFENLMNLIFFTDLHLLNNLCNDSILESNITLILETFLKLLIFFAFISFLLSLK